MYLKRYRPSQHHKWSKASKGNYIGAQATGNGLPAKTAASAASMECPCLCRVGRWRGALGALFPRPPTELTVQLSL